MCVIKAIRHSKAFFFLFLNSLAGEVKWKNSLKKNKHLEYKTLFSVIFGANLHLSFAVITVMIHFDDPAV